MIDWLRDNAHIIILTLGFSFFGLTLGHSVWKGSGEDKSRD